MEKPPRLGYRRKYPRVQTSCFCPVKLNNKETGYQMLLRSFIAGKGLTFFNEKKRVNFSVQKCKMKLSSKSSLSWNPKGL